MRGIKTKRALIVLEVEWPDKGPASGPAPGIIIAAIEREAGAITPGLKVTRFALPNLAPAHTVLKPRKPKKYPKHYKCNDCGHEE